MKDVFQAYLKTISEYKVLPAEEQKKLCKRAQEGDLKARQLLIVSNQRFVVSQAVKYSWNQEMITELISEACIGLNRAIDTYNPDKGTVFLTHANTWIFQAIQRYFLEDCKTVRVPLSRRHEKVSFISMDAPVFDDEIHPYDKFLSPEISSTPDNILENRIRNELLVKLLNTLSKKEKQVVVLYYGLEGNEPMTYQQIGAKLSLSGERIRNILNRALGKIGAKK
jgi:RNA polymerase primary sigma factor